MAETDEEGRLTRAYGFNPHTQQARTNEEDEDAEESSLWSTDPIWQADLAAGQSLKDASYHYLVTDHLGAPVLALNKAGETTWKANYEAFGKARVNPASTAQINLRLTGQYFDAETGLHQNWNRDYAPGIGRYIQVDPLGIFWGMNVYQYAYGNPMVYVDPRGDVPIILVTGAMSAGVGFVSSVLIQSLTKGIYCIDWKEAGISAGVGFFAGMLGGSGFFANHTIRSILLNGLSNVSQNALINVYHGNDDMFSGTKWAAISGVAGGIVAGSYRKTTTYWMFDMAFDRKNWWLMKEFHKENIRNVTLQAVFRNTGGGLASSIPGFSGSEPDCGC